MTGKPEVNCRCQAIALIDHMVIAAAWRLECCPEHPPRTVRVRVQWRRGLFQATQLRGQADRGKEQSHREQSKQLNALAAIRDSAFSSIVVVTSANPTHVERRYTGTANNIRIVTLERHYPGLVRG